MPKSPELKHHIANLRKLILSTEQNLKEMKASVAELELRNDDFKAKFWNHQSSSANDSTKTPAPEMKMPAPLQAWGC